MSTLRAQNNYVPLNNLDLLDERGTHNPYVDLLDEPPYEPTLEEQFEGACADDLLNLTRDVFYENASYVRHRLPEYAKLPLKKEPTEHDQFYRAARYVTQMVFEEHSRPRTELSLSDRLQNTYVGLIQATRKFDGSKGVSIISFIKPHLSHQINRWERGFSGHVHQGDMVRVKYSKDGYYKIQSLLSGISVSYDYPAQIEDIPASIMRNIDPDDIKEYLAYHLDYVPFSQETMLQETADDDRAVNPGSRLFGVVSTRLILEAMPEPAQLVALGQLAFGQTMQMMAAREGRTPQAISQRLQRSYARLSKHEAIRQIAQDIEIAA